jgi:hypothetical protein
MSEPLPEHTPDQPAEPVFELEPEDLTPYMRAALRVDEASEQTLDAISTIYADKLAFNKATDIIGKHLTEFEIRLKDLIVEIKNETSTDSDNPLELIAQHFARIEASRSQLLTKLTDCEDFHPFTTEEIGGVLYELEITSALDDGEQAHIIEAVIESYMEDLLHVFDGHYKEAEVTVEQKPRANFARAVGKHMLNVLTITAGVAGGIIAADSIRRKMK